MNFIKRFLILRKLKQWKQKNVPSNIDPRTGLPRIDVSHIVVFVNEDYPADFQQVAIIDCVSSWFFSWTSSQESQSWVNRKSEPVIYKVSSTRKMIELLNNNQVRKKTVSYIIDDPVAICVGPAWSSNLTGYNDIYERTYY